MKKDASFEIEYEPRYVAFLDILGFSEFSAQSDAASKEKTRDCVRMIFEAIDVYKGTDIKMLFISDSIILASTSNPELSHLIGLCKVVGSIQFNLLKVGFLVRGGIAFGAAQVDFEKDQKIIMGSAYTKAVQLEKLAKYPRVILDPEIILNSGSSKEKFVGEIVTVFPPSEDKARLLACSADSRNTHVDFLYRDSFLYVDYLAEVVVNMDKVFFGNLLEVIKKELYKVSPWRDKYEWLKDYTISCLLYYEYRRQLDQETLDKFYEL